MKQSYDTVLNKNNGEVMFLLHSNLLRVINKLSLVSDKKLLVP